jgi:PAS domain S-box-containing protein
MPDPVSHRSPDGHPPAAEVPRRSADAQLIARIVESSTDGILGFDPDLRYTLWNTGMERISGLSRDQVLGRPAPDVFPFLAETGELDYFRAALAGQTVRSSDRPYRVDQTGRHGWFEGHYSPLYGDDGQVIGGVAVIRDVTERKRAEENQRLLELHERSTRILESITDAFFSVDRQWRFTYLNASAERLLRRTRQDLLGKDLWVEFPGAVGTAFDEQYRLAVREQRPVTFEELYPPLDTWFEVNAYPSPEGLSVYFRDASDRRRARQTEAALRAAETRFNKLVELSPLSTQIYSPDGTPLACNPAWERLFGVTLADIPGYNVLKDPVLVELGAMPLVRRGFAGEPVVVPPIPYRPYTGAYKDQERWCGAVIYPVKDATGRVENVILIHEDVTERKAAEDALRRAADRLRLALEGARMGDWSWDAATDLLTLSDRACEIYGVPPGSAVTREAVRRHLHPDDQELSRQVLARAVADRTAYDIEYRVMKPDGSVAWVAARGLAQYDAAGRVTGMLGVAVDITPRKLIEQERDRLLESERAARGDAERASRMKDEFLATLSHELRTPLNAILGYAQLLRTGVMGQAELADGLEVIERNARAQTQIIEDLLDMSRIISGKVRLDVQPVNLVDVIEAAVRTVAPAADARGIRMQKILDPLAGPVSGDPNRLQQVFWNLLSNAIKFTPKGGRVQVVLQRVNSHVEVTVSDSGVGIKPEFLPYVFDRFRQADATAARRYGGLGLGLAIVKSLVELHGGSVRAASPGEGRGATFVVHLPLSLLSHDHDSDHPGAKAVRRPGSPAEQFHANLADVSILVVDDERDARELVRRLLVECDARVLTAASADEALPLLSADHRPDVLISDIGMPGVDGYEFIRRVRALGPDRGGAVPAVALTAFARSEDRTRAILAGYQMHVAKPVEPAELVAVVASLAGRTA